MTPLITLDWWKDLLGRAARQAQQTAGPLLLQVFDSTGRLDLATVSVAVGGAAGVTFVKAVLLGLTGVQVTASDPLWVRLLDREVPAVAGVFAGVQFTDWAGFLHADWGQTTQKAILAGIIALVVTRLDPPTPLPAA